MPSLAKKDLAKGGGGLLNDRNATFRNSRWEERVPDTGGDAAIMFVADMEMEDGASEEVTWRVGLAAWLLDDTTHEPRATVEDGQFLDVDEDNPYKIGATSEAGLLFESLEDQGVSATRLADAGANPGTIDGVKAHFVKKGLGRTYTAKKGARAGQVVEAFTYTVESIIEDEQEDSRSVKKDAAAGKGATSKSASKPAARKSEPEAEPEPDDADGVTDAEQAALDAVAVVLADPKGRVKGYSPKVNGGAVSLNQMFLAGTSGALDKSVKGETRKEATALLRDKKFYQKFNGVYLSFDSKNGLVSQL